MQWFAQAPSNIALIKYMGKQDAQRNIPANPSLSYTLPRLLTSVSMERIPGKKDHWEPLEIPGAPAFVLSEAAQDRFLAHLARIKTRLGFTGAFIVRSSNNFPQGCGLASSASSFAALTRCAVTAVCELMDTPIPPVEAQASWSREGSGSSCRSFFSPWALWRDESVVGMDFPCGTLIHQVLVVNSSEKQVSSSEAHQRILTSPLYTGRSSRVEENLKALMDALETSDWESAARVSWREFHDLHMLFSTCSDPFTYIIPETQSALDILERHWKDTGDGPIVTMDAGPNVHLLYRQDQADLARAMMQNHWNNRYDVF